MPPRREFPGLQRRRRDTGAVALYWAAPRLAVKAGYPLSVVRLHYPEGSVGLADRCQALQAELDQWLRADDLSDRDRLARAKLAAYDGRIAALVDLYETHPESPYHELQPGTRRVYRDELRLIRRVLGERRIARLNGLDFARWYKGFRAPRPAAGGRALPLPRRKCLCAVAPRPRGAAGGRSCGPRRSHPPRPGKDRRRGRDRLCQPADELSGQTLSGPSFG